jgi:phosphoribosyl 1,2-cyclic phosphate phosphodiesterase
MLETLKTGSFLHLDGVLLTHEHYDHVGGLDDLCAFCREYAVEIYAESLCGKNDSHTDTLRFP